MAKMNQFGDILKDLRKKHHMSQHALGERLGLGQTTIANYEKKTRFPNQDILASIADQFHTSIDYLLGRSHELTSEEFFDTTFLSKLKEELWALLLAEHDREAIALMTSLEMNRVRIIQIYEEVFVPLLFRTGQLWENGQISVAKEHFISGVFYTMISRISTTISEPLYPIGKGRTVICMSLSSESHTFGIRMIADYFTLLGFSPFFIGNRIPTKEVLDLIDAMNPEFIAISATVTYHLDALDNLMQIIQQHKPEMFIAVGGQALSSGVQLESQADITATNFDGLYAQLMGIYSKDGVSYEAKTIRKQ